ncbi:MAG: S-layer homology domain-containing protein, partial [Thermaerobacter sp.]|nr:S-layer homology domain-containing protein [Thermaerobacter sp.]
MRRYRKVLVIVTAIAMVLGSMGMAFAQTTTTTTTTTSSSGPVTFSDVTTSTTGAAAIMELAALGVVAGYPNGTFDPSGTITRAEFAAEMDHVMGAASAMGADQGQTSKFSDVSTSDWFNGAVNAAAGLGLFAGYPGGTFGPNNNITYAEVLTVLVNALGYKPMVNDLGGTWPANDLSVASSLGLTKNVSVSNAGAAATRGDVAQLVANALKTDMASQSFATTGTITVTQGTTPLMEQYLQFTPYTSPATDSQYVMAASGSGSTGTFTVDMPNSTNSANTMKVITTATAQVFGGVSLASLIGQQVKFITNSSGYAVYVIDSTPS